MSRSDMLSWSCRKRTIVQCGSALVEGAELADVQRYPAQGLLDGLLPPRFLLVRVVADAAVLDEEPSRQPLLAPLAVLARLEDEVVPDLVDVLLDGQEEALSCSRWRETR